MLCADVVMRAERRRDLEARQSTNETTSLLNYQLRFQAERAPSARRAWCGFKEYYSVALLYVCDEWRGALWSSEARSS